MSHAVTDDASRGPLARVRYSAGFLLALVGLSLCLGGCTTYRFKVDAIKNENLTGPALAYRVASSNPEVEESSLEFQEAAAYVKTALSAKGMYEAPAGTDADVVVEVDYGKEPVKQKVIMRTEPLYQRIPAQYERITYTVTDKEGRTRVVTQVVMVSPPRDELIGFMDVPYVVRECPKYLRMTARESEEVADDRPPREVWSIYVTNEDESEDIRSYVPLMVSAAMDSVGENASSQKDVVLSKDDERVTFVQKGL